MHDELRLFMLRLATDLELLTRFVANPAITAEDEGLSAEDRAILFSGDQRRIYFAIARPRGPAGAASAPEVQPQSQMLKQMPEAQPQSQMLKQMPDARYALAWTPWGWQWVVVR